MLLNIVHVEVEVDIVEVVVVVTIVVIKEDTVEVVGMIDTDGHPRLIADEMITEGDLDLGLIHHVSSAYFA